MKEPPIGRNKPGAQRARFAPESPSASKEQSRDNAPDDEPAYESRSRDQVSSIEPSRERSRERPPHAAPPSRARRRRRRAPLTSRQKKVITLLAALELMIALSLGVIQAVKILQPPKQTRVAFTPTPMSTPTPDAAQIEAQYINQVIAGMSLDEELGQMLMVAFEGTTYDDNSDLQNMIVNQYAGGLILYGGNLVSQDQVTALNAGAQSGARIPLFISTDQEGGLVNRLQSILGDRPSAQSIGATGDPDQAYQQGVSDAQALKQMGFNLNLAPVVDVQTLTDAQYDATTMWGFWTRMYGTTPDQVSTFAGAYLDGLESQGIIGCLKHWPGLGSATEDPHQGLPVITLSQQDLNDINFAPYKTLIARGNVDMIMDTHELVEAYDKTLPASLSPILIDQVLRQQLGYQGVIFTDALDMGALTENYSVPQSAVLAVEAGNDLLEGIWSPDQMQSVVQALSDAVTSGQIPKTQIDLSVQRILALKIKYGLLQVPGVPPQS